MADKHDRLDQASSRKPQLNLEVSEEDKVFFGQVAEARSMKLAALVRELVKNEGERLGVPAMLANYKSDNVNYQYYINAEEDTATKMGIFRQFLQKFRSDCDFSISGYEPDIYTHSVECTANSSSGENSNKIYIGISKDPATNYNERKEIDIAWLNVLQLSLRLKDKWNGMIYLAHRRHTLKGKKSILEQFVKKYSSATLVVNPTFNGGSVFKVLASDKDGEHELQIEYLPQRAGEASELNQALDDYRQQA